MRMRTLSVVALVALVALTGASNASAALVPDWGPVKLSGGKTRTLTDVSKTTVKFVAASKPSGEGRIWEQAVRVPDSSTTVRRSFVATAKNPLLNGGKPFPMAAVTLTARLTLVARGYTEKIFSSNFDRYWNVCVSGAKSVTAEGGDVYCTVWHPKRVRMQLSAVIKNYPRPKIISEVDTGAIAPDCALGDTKSETLTTYGLSRVFYECQDAQAADKADSTPYFRSYVVVSRIWTGQRWVNSTTTANLKSSGPSWVKTRTIPRCTNTDTTPSSFIDDGQSKTTASGKETVVSVCTPGGSWSVVSRTPLPAPTVSVSSFTQDGASIWRATGTLSCSYVGFLSCPWKLWFKRTNGGWGGTGEYAIIHPIPVGPFSGFAFDETINTYASGATPTGELAYSETMPS